MLCWCISLSYLLQFQENKSYGDKPFAFILWCTSSSSLAQDPFQSVYMLYAFGWFFLRKTCCLGFCPVYTFNGQNTKIAQNKRKCLYQSRLKQHFSIKKCMTQRHFSLYLALRVLYEYWNNGEGAQNDLPDDDICISFFPSLLLWHHRIKQFTDIHIWEQYLHAGCI